MLVIPKQELEDTGKDDCVYHGKVTQILTSLAGTANLITESEGDEATSSDAILVSESESAAHMSQRCQSSSNMQPRTVHDQRG